MIDKARMRADGRLGSYLLGHSPVDRALLGRLEMTTENFAALVLAHSDDASVLAALRERGFDEARVRRWSARFETTWKAYIPLWDLDEGYTKPSSSAMALALSALRIVEVPLMGLARRILKAP